MSQPRSVIVIGGGVVGLCVGLALQRAGLATTLIDRGDERPASWGNAGHLAVEHVRPLASPATWAGLHRRAFMTGGALDVVWPDAAAWGPWAARFLVASTPRAFDRGFRAMSGLAADAIGAWERCLGSRAEALLRTEGHWAVFEGEGAARRLRRRIGEPFDGPVTWRNATGDEDAMLRSAARASSPALARCHGTGQVRDPQAVLNALRQSFLEAGGREARAEVHGLSSLGDGVAIETSATAGFEAAAAVVAAGVWSKRLLETAGLAAPLVAERGYHIGFENSAWPEALSPLVFEDRQVVLTRFDQGLRATSFVEFGKAESPPDPRKWRRLEAHMRAVGALGDGPVTRWMGARPTLPDYLPAIGGGEVRGVYYAIGHAHLGLTLAAITGELLCDHIIGRAPAIELTPFALTRFGRPRARGRPSDGAVRRPADRCRNPQGQAAGATR